MPETDDLSRPLSEAFEESDNVETHAQIVTQILVPVCITMAIVIALVKMLNPPESLGGYAIFITFDNSGEISAHLDKL